jgi:hypothetical protein
MYHLHPYVPLKYHWTPTELNSITGQKIVFFIITAFRASNWNKASLLYGKHGHLITTLQQMFKQCLAIVQKCCRIFFNLCIRVIHIWYLRFSQSGENLDYGFLGPNTAYSGEWTSATRLQSVSPETPLSKIQIQMMAKFTSLTNSIFQTFLHKTVLTRAISNTVKLPTFIK